MPTGANTFLTDASNNVATVAPLGNVYTNEAFPILMASYHQSITAASGGTNLPNVPCGKVEIQNLSGNGVMWVGGVGQSAPYSGRGYELPPMGAGPGAGEKTMYVNNANQISICAFFSGQLVSFMAYGNSTTTVINPHTQGTAPNETVPQLSGTTPLSGSTNNPFNTVVTFTFSEPMDPNNISGLYIVISGQTNPSLLGHLGGTLTYLSGSVNATFAANSGQFQLSGWYIPMADASVDGFNGITMGSTQSGGPFQIQGPPIVSGFAPSSGTANYSGQAVITTFSQPMRSGTINLSGIFMLLSGTLVPHISGTVSLLTNKTDSVFTPFSGVVAVNSWYNLFVNNNCQDIFGNALFISGGGTLLSGASFQTAVVIPPDTTPPIVSGTSPVSGATNVLVIPLPAVQITMSKSINSGFVTTNTVKIHDIQISDVNVAGAVSLQSDLITIDWRPNAPLSNLDLHRMELSGIKDLAGNFMTPFSGATFTVEPALQVSGSTPVSGASSVVLSQIMELTMDRAVLSGTVNSSTCKLIDGSGNNVSLGSVSLTSDNLTVAFTPSSPLGYLINYTYNISGIADINNQQFMLPFSGATFATAAPSLTQVYNVTGSNTEQFGPNTADDPDIQGEAISSNSAPMFGKVIKQAQFSLQRTGNPSGNITAGILPSGGGNLKTTLGTMPCASVSTTTTTYTFTNLSASYAMAVDDNVVIEVTLADMDSSNYITAFFNTGTSYTATQYMARFNNPTQFVTESADIAGSFWY